MCGNAQDLGRRIRGAEAVSLVEQTVGEEGVVLVVHLHRNPIQEDAVQELLTAENVDLLGVSPTGERRELKLRVR